METTQDTGTFQGEMIPEKKRPDFLSGICIPSFIACGLMFLGGIYGIIQNTPEHMQKNIEQIRAVNPAMADQMENQMLATQDSVYLQIAPYLNFIYLLVSFLGVLLMWKQNKKGFYVSLVGELFPYIPMILMWKESMGMMSSFGGNGLGMAIIGGMLILDIVFISLYAANLKHMK